MTLPCWSTMEPFRQRERAMLHFRRMKTLQLSPAVQFSASNHLTQSRNFSRRKHFSVNRAAALAESRHLCLPGQPARPRMLRRVRTCLTAQPIVLPEFISSGTRVCSRASSAPCRLLSRGETLEVPDIRGIRRACFRATSRSYGLRTLSLSRGFARKFSFGQARWPFFEQLPSPHHYLGVLISCSPEQGIGVAAQGNRHS